MFYVIIVCDIFVFQECCLVSCLVYLVCFEQLKEEGCLVFVGLYLVIDSNDLGVVGFIGSLIVVEFDLLVVVQSWVEVDFYWVVGVYVEVVVKLFKKVLF